MATIEEVEAILDDLLGRLGGVDGGRRSQFPDRLLEARCPDLELVRYAAWRDGTLALLDTPPDARPDIRISLSSDDLVAIHSGELSFARAYGAGRVRLDASLSDLMRLRSLL